MKPPPVFLSSKDVSLDKIETVILFYFSLQACQQSSKGGAVSPLDISRRLFFSTDVLSNEWRNTDE